MDILNKIIFNAETELTLSVPFLDKLDFYEKEKGKWYLKSFCCDKREKLVYNEETGKKAPEEVVRQLLLFELITVYGYPAERIKIEQQVQFGREKKRADIIVYQNDIVTPLILSEIKSPHEKLDIQQLKSYLNAEGSPIGLGFNGKSITRFIRPYPKEFETIRDIPFEHEYQAVHNDDNVIGRIKELINDRNWTLTQLEELNKSRQYNLRAIIEELEELVLGNSGVDSFDEIFKLIYAKLYDEFEAESRNNQTLFFRDYSSPEITHQRISKLFEEAKKEWKDVFEVSEKIKLTPEHLEIVIGKLTEIKLYGANLRIIDEAFEYLVPDVSKAKKGQYFTPRVVIDACIRMINPNRKEYILDPACGSAGFLLHAMEFVWDKFKMDTEALRKRYAGKYLWGFDFEERTTKISRALMLIAGDGKTHIHKSNTLNYPKWDSTSVADLKSEGLVGEGNRFLNFDIVLSNPPFAGDIKEKAIINLYNDLLGLRYTFKMEYNNIKSIIKTFKQEFGLTFTSDIENKVKQKIQEFNNGEDIDLEDEDDVNTAIQEVTQVIAECVETGTFKKSVIEARLNVLIKFKKTDSKWDKVERHVIFIQRIMDMLKPGGRAVIVLPQGIFNNPGEKYIRKYIAEKARILAVIGLNVNSFKPHTGTKTSVLLLRKYTDSEIKQGKQNADYPMFFMTSKLSFKDTSGRYLYAQDEEGNPILDGKHNPQYLTDLYLISESFLNWGRKQYSNGDKMFDFLMS